MTRSADEQPDFDEVYGDAQPVEVLVATSDIVAGTPWDEASANIGVATIPLKIRPATFVSPENSDVVRGMVARGDIPRNQVIVAELFVDPAVASVPSTIADDQTVLTLDAPGDLPPVLPGDVLAIWIDDRTVWPIRAELLSVDDGSLSLLVDADQAEALAQVDPSLLTFVVQ